MHGAGGGQPAGAEHPAWKHGLRSREWTDEQRSLNELEDAIQNARRYYNAVVRDYNTRLESVPDVFVARIGGFTAREFFELTDEQERAVPQVDFGSGDE